MYIFKSTWINKTSTTETGLLGTRLRLGAKEIW